MDNRLILDVSRMDPSGEQLEGEVDVIDLDEEFVKPFGGVRYALTAQLFGDELLVRGHIEQDFTLVCSRCGESFDTTVAVDDYTYSAELSKGQSEVDLSEDLRESLVLELPSYPVCDESCKGIVRAASEPADACWQALDNLLK